MLYKVRVKYKYDLRTKEQYYTGIKVSHPRVLGLCRLPKMGF